MAIAVATTRQALADAYKALGAYVGLATGDPGTSATPANELSGGSPAYARVATTWTSATGGVVNGTAVTVHAPASTVTFAFIANGVTGNSMVDKTAITSTTLVSSGDIIVTPSISIS
jgi:hypothetical protein